MARPVAVVCLFCGLGPAVGCDQTSTATGGTGEVTDSVVQTDAPAEVAQGHDTSAQQPPDTAHPAEQPVQPNPDACDGCDDGNPCTRDACTRDGCAHVPEADQVLECSDELTLRRCDGGEPSEVPCPLGCQENGYNAFGPCDAEQGGCPCSLVVWPECVPGAIACVANRQIGECESARTNGASQNMWHAYHCDDICADAGYGPSTSCGIDYLTFEYACYCSELCDPPCPVGYVCRSASCWPEPDPADPSVDDDECWSDIDCGWKESCSSSGRCEQVECTHDGHCGWCERCEGHYCYSCSVDADGDCSCY